MKDSSENSAGNAHTASSADGTPPHPDDARTAEALHQLRHSLGAAWGRARASFAAESAPRTVNANAEAFVEPSIADVSDTSLHSVLGDFGKFGEAVADDALALAKEWGVSLSDLVRRHPAQTVAVAAIAGAALGIALRGRRTPDDKP